MPDAPSRAIHTSLFMAFRMAGHRGMIQALPLDKLNAIRETADFLKISEV